MGRLTEETPEKQEIRTRFNKFLFENMPTLRWHGSLYHGSPSDFIESLVKNPKPQTHHLGYLLSASTNDNVITSYSEGDDSGVVWEIKPQKPLKVIDDRSGRIQHLLIAPYLKRQDPSRQDPSLDTAIQTLQKGGFLDTELEWHRDLWDPECEDCPDCGLHLDLAGFDAIALPGFDDWNITAYTSNEIAFGSTGCLNLKKNLAWVCLHDNWIPQENRKSA